jgi:hypothetical protein
MLACAKRKNVQLHTLGLLFFRDFDLVIGDGVLVRRRGREGTVVEAHIAVRPRMVVNSSDRDGRSLVCQSGVLRKTRQGRMLKHVSAAY